MSKQPQIADMKPEQVQQAISELSQADQKLLQIEQQNHQMFAYCMDTTTGEPLDRTDGFYIAQLEQEYGSEWRFRSEGVTWFIQTSSRKRFLQELLGYNEGETEFVTIQADYVSDDEGWHSVTPTEYDSIDDVFTDFTGASIQTIEEELLVSEDEE